MISDKKIRGLVSDEEKLIGELLDIFYKHGLRRAILGKDVTNEQELGSGSQPSGSGQNRTKLLEDQQGQMNDTPHHGLVEGRDRPGRRRSLGVQVPRWEKGGSRSLDERDLSQVNKPQRNRSSSNLQQSERTRDGATSDIPD